MTLVRRMSANALIELDVCTLFALNSTSTMNQRSNGKQLLACINPRNLLCPSPNSSRVIKRCSATCAAIRLMTVALTACFSVAGQTDKLLKPVPTTASQEKQVDISTTVNQGQQLADAKTELRLAFAEFGDKDLRAGLNKLIDARREFDVSADERKQFRRALPFGLNDYIDAEKTARLAPVANKVFRFMKTPDREAIVYRAEKPLVMTWKGYYVLVSSGALELLTDDELSGLIAHETAHFFWTSDLREALEKKDERAARIVELQCDRAAIIALDLLGLSSTAYIAALEKAIVALRTFGVDDAKDKLHPSLAARQQLSRLIVARLDAEHASKSFDAQNSSQRIR